jgi:hypothetical protein
MRLSAFITWNISTEILHEIGTVRSASKFTEHVLLYDAFSSENM